MLADILIPGGLVGLAVTIIIIAALVAIVFVACRAMGLPMPDWLWQILLIVLVAIVAIFAIRFLVGAL